MNRILKWKSLKYSGIIALLIMLSVCHSCKDDDDNTRWSSTCGYYSNYTDEDDRNLFVKYNGQEVFNKEVYIDLPPYSVDGSVPTGYNVNLINVTSISNLIFHDVTTHGLGNNAEYMEEDTVINGTEIKFYAEIIDNPEGGKLDVGGADRARQCTLRLPRFQPIIKH